MAMDPRRPSLSTSILSPSCAESHPCPEYPAFPPTRSQFPPVRRPSASSLEAQAHSCRQR